MHLKSYLVDSKEERKAFRKAIRKTDKLNRAADFALIRSLDDSISDALTRLVECIVRYNEQIEDYDAVFAVLLRETYRLMRNKPKRIAAED